MLRGRLGLSIAALQLAAAGALGAGTSMRSFSERVRDYDPFKESWNMSRKERREMYRRNRRPKAGSKLARKAARGLITIRKGW